jgi:hypothetical protein
MDFVNTKPSATLEGIPQEIMTMIINSAEKSTSPYKLCEEMTEHVLSAEDACNVRLASRRMEQTTLDSFRKRFFTCRKHMISRHSLEALWDISLHPVFGEYIREIAIGTEGVNPDFEMWLAQEPEERALWKARFDDIHQTMVRDQKDFEASGDAVDMLSSIFKSIHSLKHVRIDSFPEDLKEDKAWLECWGSASILRQMGYSEIEKRARPRCRYALAREYPQHRHFSVALKALLAIKDRQDWNLDVDLRTLGLSIDESKKLFQLATQAWQESCKRIRRFVLNDSIGSSGELLEGYWVAQVLDDCVNIETLKAKGECKFQQIFYCQPWMTLKVLSLQKCFVQDTFFQGFLEKQSHTLEVIVCEDIHLACSWEAWPVQLLSDEYRTKNPSWFEKFETMQTMPHLQKVILDRLYQDNLNKNLLKNYRQSRDDEDGSLKLAVSRDEIAQTLTRLVDEQCTVSDGSEHTVFAFVWFPQVPDEVDEGLDHGFSDISLE